MRKLFFERAKESRGEFPQCFTYDALPNSVRNRIVLIWNDLGHDESKCEKSLKEFKEALGVIKPLAEGWVGVGHRQMYRASEELKNFFLNTSNIDYALTVLEEIGCLFYPYNTEVALKRINERLRLAGIGWKHTGQKLIKIEDETFFDEVTSRCLSILGQNKYHSTQDHLIKAYEELKLGPSGYTDALTDCRMAFETIIKTKLNESGYSDVKNKNWSQLKANLLKAINAPTYWESYFNTFISLMEGNVTPSNQEGSHGGLEGSLLQADEVFVRYIINQTAVNILFIAEVEFKQMAK